MALSARWMMTLMAALTLTISGAADAKRSKAAKTEVSKAVGKCVGLVLGGALLGALVGGRNNRGEGAAIGAGAGAAACAVVMANAKRQDRIIAAQREAAAAGGADFHYASFRDDNGREVQMASRAQDAAITGPLVPVKYEVDGASRVSPEITDAAPTCRYVSSEIAATDGSAAIPNQLYCRTADNSWEPYALGKA